MVSDQRKAPGLKQEWGMGGLITAPQAPTAPATVCGERPSTVPLIPKGVGKAEGSDEPRVRRLAMQGEKTMPSGVTVRRDMMTTLNQTAAKTQTSLMSIVLVALVGATMVFTVGLAHSQTLHDAAHDMRHSSGFPCH
jgi:cobalt transporter subunit CbtB